ncbi:hypothetical protein COEX109129_42105 [Corallococcus exiguus]
MVHEEGPGVEVDGVLRWRRLQRVVAQVPREREHHLAVVLEAVQAEVGEVVRARVVAHEPVEEAEVEARLPPLEEDGEVRVVLQPPVHLVEQRAGLGGCPRARQVLDEPAVAGARLEHQRGPLRAPGLEVEDHGDLVRQRVMERERPRPHEPRLLRVREEKEDVVAQRRARAQRPQRLQHRRHAGPVIRGPGRRGHGVVVRDDGDDATAVLALHVGKHVVDGGARDGVLLHVRVDGGRGLHLRRDAQSAHGVHQVLAHLAVGLRAHGVWPGRDARQVLPRTPRGEHLRGRCRGQRGGRGGEVQGEGGGDRGDDRGREAGDAGAHARAFTPPLPGPPRRSGSAPAPASPRAPRGRGPRRSR